MPSRERRYNVVKHDKFYACPYCGAALDPGEKCDCRVFDKKHKENESMEELTMTEQFSKALTDALDGIATVEPTTIHKVNETKQGLSIHYPGENISPIIYPEDILRDMSADATVEMAAKKTAELLKKMRDTAPTMSDLDLSPEGAKKNLVCVVMNEAENKELLKEIPHKKICGDLVMAARYRLSDEGSFVVKNEHCTTFNMTGEEILEQGMKNTNQRGFKIQEIYEVLLEMMGGQGMKEEFLDAILGKTPKNAMYVISNDIKMDGAIAIASKEAMEKVYKTIGEGFYILPSSRHEIIAVRESMVTDPKDLKAMVEEVNATEVSRKDRLSDNVYHYDATKGVQIYE